MSCHSDCCTHCLQRRLEEAEKERDEARRALQAFTLRDQDAMLDTLTICGIPAREMKDIFEAQAWYRTHGGTPNWLRTQMCLVEADRMKQAIAELAMTWGYSSALDRLFSASAAYGRERNGLWKGSAG